MASRFVVVVLPELEGPAISTSFVVSFRAAIKSAMAASFFACRVSAIVMYSPIVLSAMTLLSDPTDPAPRTRARSRYSEAIE